MIADTGAIVSYVRGGNPSELSRAQLEIVKDFQSAVEGEIRQILRYNPAQATYTEFYPDSASNFARETETFPGMWESIGGRAVASDRGSVQRREIILRALPVRSITSIHENTSAWTTGVAGGDFPVSTLLSASNYYLDQIEAELSTTGKIVRNYGAWYNVPRSIKVTYVAGYTAAELAAEMPELVHAIKISVSRAYLDMLARYEAAKSNGQLEASTSVTDFSISYLDPSSAGFGGFRNVQTGNVSLIPDECRGAIGRRINLSRYLG